MDAPLSMFPGFLTPRPKMDNVIYGQEFCEKRKSLPGLFSPKSGFEQNIISKLSFHALEHF